MKKYKNLLLSLLALTAALLFSCSKYEQDYTLKPLNKVTISTDKDTYSIIMNTNLVASASHVESTPSTDEYAYEWRLFDQTTPTNWLLSNTKDVNFKIELAPVLYYMRVKVTNKRTGEFYIKQVDLRVNPPYEYGYLITSNLGSQGKLSFLRTTDETVIHGVPELSNSTKTYPGKALGAANMYNAFNTGGLADQVMYLTDQNVYRLDGVDFFELGRGDDVLEPGIKFNTSASFVMFGTPISTTILGYIVGDGGLYAGLAPSVLAPYSPRIPGDYNLFNGGFNTSPQMFYDNKYKRFMQIATNTRVLTVTTGSASAAFNMSNVGLTLIAADQGFVDGEYIYLMQNAAGVRYLLGTKGVAATPLYQTINNSPDIANATEIAVSTVVKHLYYSSGNKIYVYDYAANVSQLVYTFPASQQIKALKMIRTGSTRLIVGVSKSATEGEVHYFDLANDGSFVGNAPVKTFTGFGDIVSISLKSAY